MSLLILFALLLYCCASKPPFFILSFYFHHYVVMLSFYFFSLFHFALDISANFSLIKCKLLQVHASFTDMFTEEKYCNSLFHIISIVARVTCTKLPTSIVVNKPWIPFRPFVVFFLWSKVVSDKIVCIRNHCSFLILWPFNLFHLWTPKNWMVILFTNGHTLPFREDMRIWCCIKMKPSAVKFAFSHLLFPVDYLKIARGKFMIFSDS